ncbi:MAG TPA: alpha/beta hydrolase [Pyrinomonadaceae bacterium]|jgi:acetyl esterase/lipase|nr:alpha/beta hydrolase [Pyrinomonadaceae bacterium]
MQFPIIRLILVLILSLSGQSVTSRPFPPPQPETGPGGKQLPHAAVIKNRYGKGGTEYWIYEPDKPKPKQAPVVIFLHGWGGTNPLYYGAWIDHIVKRGNIVVFPRYQSSILTRREDFIPNTLDAIKAALKQLQTEPGHVRPELTRVATVGHSLGGVLSASVAALAKESNLPRVRAVMSVEPGLTRQPAMVPMADLKKIESDTLLLSIAGDRDTLVEDYDAKRIYYESTRVSAANKDFVKLVTDDRGFPSLIANHRAPTAPDKEYDNGEGDLTSPRSDRSSGGADSEADSPRNPAVNALDYYGTWKLFDALCDAAFYGKNREYALGKTPQQRFMGKWSDGVAVKELVVTEKP